MINFCWEISKGSMFAVIPCPVSSVDTCSNFSQNARFSARSLTTDKVEDFADIDVRMVSVT